MNKENKEIEDVEDVKEFIKKYNAIKKAIIDLADKIIKNIPAEIEAETKKLRFRDGIQYKIMNPYGPDEWIRVEDIINNAEIAPYKRYKILIEIADEMPTLLSMCLERVKENNKKLDERLAKLYQINNTFS